MDIYSNKKVVGGLHSSRSGSSTAFPDNHEDRSLRYGNRSGCSTRTRSHVGNPEKLKLSRLAFFSTGRKATVGSSSGTISTLVEKRKPQQGTQNMPFLQERGTLGSTIIEEQVEDFVPNARQKGIVNLEGDPTTASIQTEFAQGNFQVTSNTGTRRPRHPMTVSGNQESSSSSSARYSVGPRNDNHNFRHSQNQVTSTRRYGFRNLSCTSISDVLPSGCSSDVGNGRSMDGLRKIYSDGGSSSRSKGTVRTLTGRNTDSGESSFARSNGTFISLSEGDQNSHRSGPSSRSPFMLEHPLPQPTSRQTRSRLTSRDGIVLVGNQRAASGDGRTRPFEHIGDNTIMVPETVGFPPPSVAPLSHSEAASATSSHSFSTSLASISQASSGQLGLTMGSARTMRRADPEDNNIRGFCGPWMHRDGYQRFNMEGIAEVLLALERIEQDEVLTYEELMVLESNVFISGVSFHDRHRDMRMDIDNMSYEELLALEEKMGTVSTALTEEALSTCLKRSIYIPVLRSGIASGDDDVKCSICQEEYNAGDEVAKLHCDHLYHVTCIHQWLRQKNWCPICKSSACASQPSKPIY